MLPIYVMNDSGLDQLEVAAVTSAIREWTEIIQGVEVTYFGSEPWCEGEYSSADWYIQNTEIVRGYHGKRQLNADRLLDLVINEPWQEAEPHVDVVITSWDLTAFDEGERLAFVFGVAGERATVQSIARFRDRPVFDRYIAIKTLIWHELGHIFGMAADLRRSHTEYRLGPHCTNRGCAMRQGLSVPEWVDNAWEVSQSSQIYCNQCLADVTAPEL